ncbi:MAG: hypothetical protein ACYCO3_05650 [Mycobacteriales bacterium]
MALTEQTDIVAALREVPGVAGADLEPDTDGGVGLLRLSLAEGADEVRVAAEVGRLLRERFGLGVDADRVQLLEDTAHIELPEPRDARRGRPAIARMQLLSSGLEVTAIVTLRHGQRLWEGQSTGTATQIGVQRAVAAATLRALEDMLGANARFELEDVDVTVNGRNRTALVSLLMLSTAGSERLTGAATVREDVRQACIRATLDAANRRLEPLLRT